MEKKYLCTQDSVLDRVIHQVGELRSSYSLAVQPVMALVQAIVGQQLSLKAAACIWKRLCRVLTSGCGIEELCQKEDTYLQALGLSTQKILYLRAVVAYAQQHDLRRETLLQWDDPTVIKELCLITGVGLWTAQMVLMFCLQRPDVFAYGDLRIRQAMQQLYKLPDAAVTVHRLQAIAAYWVPYRTLACRYLWEWYPGGMQHKKVLPLH